MWIFVLKYDIVIMVMVLNYEEIRRVFDKCRIVLSNDGVSAVFMDFPESQWISQGIDGDEKLVFANLVSLSESVRIIMHPKQYVRVLFNMPLSLDSDLVFQPLNPESQIVDMDGELDNISGFEFLRSFYGVDLNNEDEVLKAAGELIDRIFENRDINLASINRWDELRNTCLSFIESSSGFKYEIEEPSRICDSGVFVIYLDSENKKSVQISGESKDWFLRIIDLSDLVTLEVNNESAEMVFIITAYS